MAHDGPFEPGNPALFFKGQERYVYAFQPTDYVVVGLSALLLLSSTTGSPLFVDTMISSSSGTHQKLYSPNIDNIVYAHHIAFSYHLRSDAINDRAGL